MITIIPAIDMIGGECVRLTQGDYDRKTSYYKDPLEVALRYADCGIRRLHLVDLDGAKASHPVNLAVLERIVLRTPLEVQYGGGIKSKEALEAVFSSGAKRAICGSIAATQPDMFSRWLADFGPQRMVLGADTRDGLISINGWQQAATMGVEELIEHFRPAGLSQVICTDIARDGMQTGPNVEATRKLIEQTGMNIIGSGGVGQLSDLYALRDAGCAGAIVGKALYNGNFTLAEALKLED